MNIELKHEHKPFIQAQIASGKFTNADVDSYAKASGDVAGLDAVIDEMGRRFNRRSKKKQPEVPVS